MESRKITKLLDFMASQAEITKISHSALTKEAFNHFVKYNFPELTKAQVSKIKNILNICDT